MKNEYSSNTSTGFETHGPDNTDVDLSAICKELCITLNETLGGILGKKQGESCEETVKLWKAYADEFRRTLHHGGWSDADIEIVMGENNRLADMLEYAIALLNNRNKAALVLRRIISDPSEQAYYSVIRYPISLL